MTSISWSERYINEREPMETTQVKLCTQCVSCKTAGGHPACHDKRNMVQSLVDGRERCRQSCDYLRESDGQCGPDALWFIPRDFDSQREAAEDAARMEAGFGAALELTKKAVK